MFKKFEKKEKRYKELEKMLADSQIIANQSEYQKLAKEYSDIAPIVTTLQEYRRINEQVDELEKLLKK